MAPEIRGKTNRRFLAFWAIFCSFGPKFPKKMKNVPGDITILHKCTKNRDHMLDYS